ncbi:hypothetical protein Y032_0273g964 [Ancylostoma ceylanicum]|uniref:Uncharacterized protein n=1 Tax=Ancylostoma ceylanicum TaxID=53326 RepID=A0A016S7X6_9BILA|nr:hypothetical protein Y032_0273g964 [Ancylostoma ceylanicum]
MGRAAIPPGSAHKLHKIWCSKRRFLAIFACNHVYHSDQRLLEVIFMRNFQKDSEVGPCFQVEDDGQ